jgi:tetratricopeptide (TPR) repeat protein
VEAWPTLFVIDPERQVATFKWLGGANPADLVRLLDDAAQELHPAPGAGEAEQALARADALEAQGDPAGAAARYREALSRGLAGPARDRALLSWLGSLQSAGDLAGCVQLVRERLGAAADPTLQANLAASGLQCALEQDPKAPGRAEAVTRFQDATQKLLDAPGLNADDRSSLYDVLVDARKAAGEAEGARELGRKWLAFLEGEAAKASTPEARAVFDPHTVNAALAAGEPARALPALERSERDLPQDYNAPARLALVQRELGHYPEALAASDRALSKVYGPRTLRVLELKASIYGKMGDAAQQKATLDQALAFAQALPAGQRSDKALARLQALRAKLGP